MSAVTNVYREVVVLAVIAVSVLLAACSAPQSSVSGSVDLIACPETPSQMCTMHYDPVCAHDRKGRQSTQGNACSACGDAAVVGYVPGECPAPE